MFLIPIKFIFFLGLAASLRDFHNVFVYKKYKNIGSFFSTSYLTFVCFILSMGGYEKDFLFLINSAITVVFIDKIIVFAYEIYISRVKTI